VFAVHCSQSCSRVRCYHACDCADTSRLLYAALQQDPDDTNPVPRSFSALITSDMPTQDEWAQTYDNDPDCKLILTHLPSTWSAAKVKKVHACYPQPLLKGAIGMVNNFLCNTHLVDGHTYLLLLVIVPTSLRQSMFTAYHTSPVCGHMGRYKTLFCLRQRFLWPSMRKFVQDLVDAFHHCALTNSRKYNKSEIISAGLSIARSIHCTSIYFPWGRSKVTASNNML
jgi:hypothetical protein